MKVIPALLLVTLALVQGFRLDASEANPNGNPVGRVVDLLRKIQSKLTKEFDLEKAQWSKYFCWATNVISEKTKFISIAEDRIDVLKAKVADLTDFGAGNDVTNSRGENENSVESAEKELTEAKDARQSAINAYRETYDHTQKTLQALEEAITVIASDKNEGSGFKGTCTPPARPEAPNKFENPNPADIVKMTDAQKEAADAVDAQGEESGKRYDMDVETTDLKDQAAKKEETPAKAKKSFLAMNTDMGVQVSSPEEAVARVLLSANGENDEEFVKLRLLASSADPAYTESEAKGLDQKNTFSSKFSPETSKKVLKLLRTMYKQYCDKKDDLITGEKSDAKAWSNEEEPKGLLQTLDKQLSDASGVLNGMESEKSSRQEQAQEALDEIDRLEQQNEDDKGFIEQTKKDKSTNKGLQEKREAMRHDELAGIQAAIAELNADENRDNFTRSFKSVLGFLQTGSKTTEACTPKRKLMKVASLLRVSAETAQSSRLTALAAILNLRALKAEPKIESKQATAGGGSKAKTQAIKDTDFFGDVIKAIDKLIGNLEKEGENDAEAKGACESERSQQSVEARDNAVLVDQNNDRTDNANSFIETNNDAIQQAEKEIEELTQNIIKATAIRKEENTFFKQEDKDNKAAMASINRAYDILQKFYKKHDLGSRDLNTSLMQTMTAPLAISDPPEIKAGQAPPPPPAVPAASGKYGGAKYGAGVLQLLQILHSGLKADEQNQINMEDAAEVAFQKQKKADEKAIKDREGLITQVSGKNSDMEGENSNRISENKGYQKQVDAAVKAYQKVEKSCDFISTNFEKRVTARNAEMDGLKKAKAILQGMGSKASMTPDRNREMNVDDAFLQEDGDC